MSQKHPSILGSLVEDIAFVIATVIMLAAVFFWWYFAPKVLDWAMKKEPVPWPAHVQVDDGWRNTSFLTTFGPYNRAGDGELVFDKNRKPVLDGLDDGEIIHKGEDLEILFAGAGMSVDLRDRRCSDWYLSRIYSDSRVSSGSPFYKYWHLDITYYTGGLDTVPHISSTCLVAGGAKILDETNFQVTVPGAAEPWNKPLTFKRVLFEMNEQRYLQYYLFSINGSPESSREIVRAKLANPFSKYVYFAKVQIAPRFPVTDEIEMDKKTREFINYCLPAVLKDIPMPSDIQRLKSTGESQK